MSLSRIALNRREKQKAVRLFSVKSREMFKQYSIIRAGSLFLVAYNHRGFIICRFRRMVRLSGNASFRKEVKGN